MKRAALLVALLALPGCLTECQAVGHGVIGRGAVLDGVVAGGAVGGRPAASGCVVPGSPSLLYDASALALSDSDPVITWDDTGSVGADVTQGTASARPTYVASCLNGQPCVSFDGGDFLRTASGFTSMSQPNITFGVGETAATNDFMYDGDDASNRHVYYTLASGSRKTIFAGANLSESVSSFVGDQWDYHVARFDGASSNLRVNGSSIATGNAGTHALDGFTIGASNTDGSLWEGRIAIVGVYDDASVTVADIEAFIECRYGSFPQ